MNSGQVGHIGFCSEEGSCAFRSPSVNTFTKGHSCLSYRQGQSEEASPYNLVVLEEEVSGQFVTIGPVPITDEPPPGGVAVLNACRYP